MTRWIALIGIPVALQAAAEPAAVARMGAHFEPRGAQTFVLRGARYALELTPSQAVWKGATDSVRMTMAGANPSARIEGMDRMRGVSNYLTGLRSNWVTGVPHFARVKQNGLYRGIDAVFYQGSAGIEYDFVVRPGADPTDIALDFDVEGGIRVSPDGDLLLGSSGITHRKPVAWQTTRGVRKAVDVRFIADGNRARFVLGAYDRSLPLTIDPTIIYSTVYTGSGDDQPWHVSYSDGYLYVTGMTTSPDFPANGTFHTGSDVFAMRMTVDGEIVYSTFLGGGTGQSISGDASGSACVTGTTSDSAFPVTPGAYQPTLNNSVDAFVVKLGAKGAPIYSTYLGGGAQDNGNATMLRDGHCWVAGLTNSPDFPRKLYTGGLNQSSSMAPTNITDGFLSRFDPSGALIYSRFIGSTSNDGINGLYVSPDTKIYVAGWTHDQLGDFPLHNAFRTAAQGDDGFLMRLEFTNYIPIPSIVFSTLLGGIRDERINGIVADPTGNMYVVGTTASLDLVGRINSNAGGDTDAFVSQVNASGALSYSRYIGGTGADAGLAIAYASGSSVIIAGETQSPNINPLGPPILGGLWDAFLFKVDAGGSSDTWRQFGGSDTDIGAGVAYVPIGPHIPAAAIVVGWTKSTNFPTTTGAHPIGPPAVDAFLVKFSF